MLHLKAPHNQLATHLQPTQLFFCISCRSDWRTPPHRESQLSAKREREREMKIGSNVIIYNIMQQCVRNLLSAKTGLQNIYTPTDFSAQKYIHHLLGICFHRKVSIPVSPYQLVVVLPPSLSLSTFTMLLTGCSCLYNNILAAIAWCTYITQLWPKAWLQSRKETI